MRCLICGSDAHEENDNWQCGMFAQLRDRIARLEARVLELSKPSKLVTEVSTNG